VDDGIRRTVTKGHALSVLAMHLFLSHGLLQTFELPLNRLRNFIRKIESGYRNNPCMHCAPSVGGCYDALVLTSRSVLGERAKQITMRCTRRTCCMQPTTFCTTLI